MVRAVRVPEPVPFSTINVTPLIDVMLVLLIVMIISIPMATHKLPIDLPSGPSPTTEQPHELAIDRQGALFWDGRRIADAELPALLGTARANSHAVLHMNTDPDARYARFDAVLAMVKRAGIERLGFVGHRPLPE